MDAARSKIVPVPGFFFILKAAQIGLSVLVLALSGASIALEFGYGYYGGQGYAIFVCIVTWISCGYYIASTRFMPNLFHPIPVIVLEVFLWIWWLSTWTTLAYWASWAAIFNDDFYTSVSGTALQAVLGIAAAVAAINWILVFTTAIVFIMHFLRNQRGQSPAAVQQQPKYEMHPQQQPQFEQQVPQQQTYAAQGQYGQQQYSQPQYGQQQAQFDQSGEHKIAV